MHLLLVSVVMNYALMMMLSSIRGLRLLMWLGLVVLAAATGSNEAKADESVSSLNLVSFRAYQVNIFQSEGRCYSGGLSWAPRWKMSEGLSVRGLFGAMLLKDMDSNFIALDGEALLSLRKFGNWDFEAGPGVQKWGGIGEGTGFSANIGVGRHLTANWMLSVGYTALFAPDHLTHEFKIGADFSI